VAARLRVPEGLQEAAKVAKAHGWTIERRRNNHLTWRAPSGAKVFLPSTPSGGRRSIENSLALLRRNGLPV
jgi:hypothetical protein